MLTHLTNDGSASRQQMYIHVRSTGLGGSAINNVDLLEETISSLCCQENCEGNATFKLDKVGGGCWTISEYTSAGRKESVV